MSSEAPFQEADSETGADDPTVDDVSEASYVGTGAMGEDTTDDAWGTSVWSGDAKAPADGGGAAPGGAGGISYSASTPDLPDAKEQTYPSPSGAPPTASGASPAAPGGYTPPSLQDAPIAQDLYSGYGDFDGGPPPTEEVPSTVMEDIGSSYNAPMNVPEPPPIPGILDRFTPPPVERSGYSQPTKPKVDTGLPSYLDGVEGPAVEDKLPEPPGRKKKAAAAAPSRRDVDDDNEGGGPPLLVIAGVVVVGLGAIAGVVALAGLMVGAFSASGVTEGPREDVKPGVEVRGDMTKKPGLIGVPDPEPADPVPVAVPEPAPEPPDPAPAPEPAPAAPAPTRPVPPPKPAPAPVAAPKPTSSLGTLKVGANRRVVIFVDGRAVGYPPQKIELAPGTYTVSAALPGQADTEKKRTVTITGPGTTASVDFAF